MKLSIKDLLKTPKIALDFGTANCVMIKQGSGVVVQEPTVVAVSPSEKKVLAIGDEAKVMLGKVPQGIEARRPLKNGGISNYRLAEALLRKFFDEGLGRVRLVKPEVIVSVPAGLNSVEERAIIQALNSVGVSNLYLFPEPIAAAIGAEMPIHTSSGNLIVNLGGGTAEIAVLSMNGIVAYNSHKGAGDALNDAIVNYVKHRYDVEIGEQSAELVKWKIGTALPVEKELSIDVRGKNVKTGLPQTLTLKSNELVDSFKPVLKEITDSIKGVLGDTPPELLADTVDRGVVLSGGTSLLRNLDELLVKSLGIPAHVVDDPLTCVVRGLDKVLGNVEMFKRSVKGG